MRSFFLILILASSLAYEVKILSGRCYVSGYYKAKLDTRKMWFDMSRYLVEDYNMYTVISTCSDYQIAQNQDARAAQLPNYLENSGCFHRLGDSNSNQFLNGRHLYLFFNPCRKIDHVRSFTYEDNGRVDITNNPNDANYNLTHCRGLTTDDISSGYACFGLDGQALFQHETMGFVLDFHGDLRAVSDRIFENADIVFDDSKNEYGDYKINMKLDLAVGDIFAQTPTYLGSVPSEAIPLLGALMKYKINLDISIYPKYKNNNVKYSVVIYSSNSERGIITLDTCTANEDDDYGYSMIEIDKLTGGADKKFTIATLVVLFVILLASLL